MAPARNFLLYLKILLAMGYKRFEKRSFVLLLLAHCSHVSPISRCDFIFLAPPPPKFLDPLLLQEMCMRICHLL